MLEHHPGYTSDNDHCGDGLRKAILTIKFPIRLQYVCSYLDALTGGMVNQVYVWKVVQLFHPQKRVRMIQNFKVHSEQRVYQIIEIMYIDRMCFFENSIYLWTWTLCAINEGSLQEDMRFLW